MLSKTFIAFAARIKAGQVRGFQVKDYRIRIYFVTVPGFVPPKPEAADFTPVNKVCELVDEAFEGWLTRDAESIPYDEFLALQTHVLETMNAYAVEGLTYTEVAWYGWEPSVETMAGKTPPIIN